MADITFRTDPKNLGEFERKLLRRYPEAVTRGLQRGGKRCVKILKARTLAQNIWDRGRMYRGWSTEMVSPRKVRVFNKEQSAVYVEGGRSAGAMPPPVTPILQWVLRHFAVQSRQEALGIAFAIAKTIANQGIPARPVMTGPGALKEMAAAMSDEMEKATAKAVAEIVG